MFERWIEIYQLMETWLALLTSIFTAFSLWIVWKGYLLAKDYLSQHRKKIKEERKIQLVIELKKDLYRLRKLLTKFYHKPKGLWYAEDLEKDGGFEIMKEFVFGIARSLENGDLFEIGQIRADVETKIDLLKIKGLRELYSEFEKSIGFFVIRYLDLDHNLKNKLLSVEDCKDKFFAIPIDFRSVKYKELRASEEAYISMQNLLTEEYHSDG